MSVVLCLPVHLRVSTAASRGRPPHGNASKAFHRRVVTKPSRATRGHQPRAARRSSSQLAARSAAQQLAAQRSGSQRRPATALSSSRSPQRRPEHRPDRAATVKEVHRPRLLHQRVPSADQQGRSTTSTTTDCPAPAAHPIQCCSTRLINHHQSVEWTSRASTPPAAIVYWQEAGRT